MRLIFGCPVYKSFVAVEAGGLVTLGEVNYLWKNAWEAFSVGRALPGVEIKLLHFSPTLLPGKIDDPPPPPLSVAGSHLSGIEHGTMEIKGVNQNTATKIGILCGRRGNEIFVFGRLISLLESRDRQGALCEALEQLLVQLAGPWLMQLFLVARPAGVVGIAVVRLEELWRLVRMGRHSHTASGEELCRDPDVKTLCLKELRKIADKAGFSDAERPRALHLELEPFSLESGLQSPMFQLRRDHLNAKFEATLNALYNGLQSYVANADSPLASPPDPDNELGSLALVRRHRQGKARLSSFPSGEWG